MQEHPRGLEDEIFPSGASSVASPRDGATSSAARAVVLPPTSRRARERRRSRGGRGAVTACAARPAEPPPRAGGLDARALGERGDRLGEGSTTASGARDRPDRLLGGDPLRLCLFKGRGVGSRETPQQTPECATEAARRYATTDAGDDQLRQPSETAMARSWTRARVEDAEREQRRRLPPAIASTSISRWRSADPLRARQLEIAAHEHAELMGTAEAADQRLVVDSSSSRSSEPFRRKRSPPGTMSRAGPFVESGADGAGTARAPRRPRRRCR